MKKTRLLRLLLILAIVALAGTACSGKTTYSINVSAEVHNAFCGKYTAPIFEVTNDKGEFMAEFSVRLKSVTDPAGTEVEVGDDGLTIQADEEGIYSFVFTADSKKVADAVFKVKFSKKPPKITFDSSQLPEYYFKGVPYDVPAAEFSTDAVLSKSNIKIFYAVDSTAERELITPSEGRFVPQYNIGNYIIAIHAEGEYGNVNEAEYIVPAQIGPDEIVDSKIGYFDEGFGFYQIKPVFSELKHTDDIKYKKESGSLEISAKYGNYGKIATLKNLITKDVSDYDALIFRVYNPNSFTVSVLFHEWFGMVDIPANSWGAVDIETSAITGPLGSQTITSLEDITGLDILALKNYKPLEAGEKLYFSAMYAYNYPSAPEAVPGKVAYFDDEYGVMQLKASSSTAEYSTEQAYGGEAGSTKITISSDLDGQFMALKNIALSDLSGYDYIIFRVYNTGDKMLNIGIGNWGNAEWCPKGSWVTVKVNVASLPDGRGANVNGLIFYANAVEPAGLLDAGTVFYLSAIYAEKNDQEIPGKIVRLDGKSGVGQLANTAQFDVEFSTDFAYGQETGATKVTVLQDADGQFVSLKNIVQSDVSGYDYIIFRLYNTGAPIINIGVGGWANAEWCVKDTWTTVKVNIAALPEGRATDINGLIFYVNTVEPSAPIAAGTVFYLSALYGMNNN